MAFVIGIQWRLLACSGVCCLPIFWGDICYWLLLAFGGVCWRSVAFVGVQWRSVAFSGVCWRAVAFSGVCWRAVAFGGVCCLPIFLLLAFVGIRWRLFAFSGVQWRLLAFGGVCWRSVAFVGVCWRLSFSETQIAEYFNKIAVGCDAINFPQIFSKICLLA